MPLRGRGRLSDKSFERLVSNNVAALSVPLHKNFAFFVLFSFLSFSLLALIFDELRVHIDNSLSGLGQSLRIFI